MKIAFISDTHINIWKRNNPFFIHMDSMFDSFFELCKKEKVDLIIHLGDMFDAKQQTSTIGLLNIKPRWQSYGLNWEIINIVGNHDSPIINDDDSKSKHMIELFNGLHNITVIDCYKKIEKSDCVLHFVPYLPDDRIKNVIDSIQITQGKPNFLFGHFGVKSFAMNILDESQSKLFVDTVSAISMSDLEKFDKVFLGHYHSYQNKKNVTYVSSPLESKFNDEFGDHGFVIFDTLTQQHTFHKNEHSPKFITISLTTENVETLKKLKNHYIRLVIPKKINSSKAILLRQFLLKNNFDVRLEYEKEDKGFTISTIEDWQTVVHQDPETILENYLDKISDILSTKGFDKIELLKLILED